MRKEEIEKFKNYEIGITLDSNFKLLGIILDCDLESFHFRTSQQDSMINYTRVDMLVIRTFEGFYFKYKNILLERDSDRRLIEFFIGLFSKEQQSLIKQIDLKDNIFLIKLHIAKRAEFLTYYKSKDVITTEGLGNKKDKYDFELVK